MRRSRSVSVRARLRCLRMRVSTESYYSPESHARERQAVWMRAGKSPAALMNCQKPATGRCTRSSTSRMCSSAARTGRFAASSTPAVIAATRLCEGKGQATSSFARTTAGVRIGRRLLVVPKPDFDGPLEEFVGRRRNSACNRCRSNASADSSSSIPTECAAVARVFWAKMADLLAPYRSRGDVPVGFNVREISTATGRW